MALHYVFTCFKYIIISPTSSISILRKVRVRGQVPVPILHIWSGLGQRVMKQRPWATAALRTREVLMMSQRFHTCNQTTQYPGAKCPAVRFLQEPLMKKFFRVGQEQQVQTPSTSQWTHPSGPHKQTQKFWHQNLQIKWRDWILVWYDSLVFPWRSKEIS